MRDPRLARFYQAGTVSADTPLEQAPLLALDVETTGLDSRRDSIVSIGLVPFDLRRIRCAEARYWVVKPTRELSAESVTFHQCISQRLNVMDTTAFSLCMDNKMPMRVFGMQGKGNVTDAIKGKKIGTFVTA